MEVVGIKNMELRLLRYFLTVAELYKSSRNEAW